MPSKKRQIAPYTCDCCPWPEHENEIECQNEETRRLHMSIMTKVIIGSPMITIIVGKDPHDQAFSVHSDLLALHSGYFRDKIREEDPKYHIPQFEPSLFAVFISWLYGYELSLDNKTLKAIGLSKPTTGDELWALGSFLKAPRDQNYVFKLNRQSYGAEANYWICVDYIELVYNLTEKNALFRSFFADLLNHDNPLQNLESGSECFLKWEALFERCPDIRIDMDNALRKEWNGTRPWDDEYQMNYMEKEIPLDEAYEIQILEKRSLADIKRRVKTTKEVISHIDHLQRKRWECPCYHCTQYA